MSSIWGAETAIMSAMISPGAPGGRAIIEDVEYISLQRVLDTTPWAGFIIACVSILPAVLLNKDSNSLAMGFFL